MASIDLYLRSMTRFGATHIVLRSGANVTLRFPTGDRHATQTTPHAQLQQMVGAAAPDGARSAIVGGQASSFRHTFEGQDYQVEVDPKGSEWVVTIGPAGDDSSGGSSGLQIDDSPIGGAGGFKPPARDEPTGLAVAKTKAARAQVVPPPAAPASMQAAP